MKIFVGGVLRLSTFTVNAKTLNGQKGGPFGTILCFKKQFQTCKALLCVSSGNSIQKIFSEYLKKVSELHFSRRFSIKGKMPDYSSDCFLVGAFLEKSARLLEWLVFFSSDYNLTLIGPLFLQSKLLKLLA